jgi:DNA polymerase III subunit epsilon
MRENDRSVGVRARPRGPGETRETDGGEQESPAAPSEALRRRAADVLTAHGAPMPADDLAAAVFGVGGVLPGAAGPWITMLDRMLSTSPAFARDRVGEWRLAIWESAYQRLEQVEFAIVDVETTGLAAGRHRLIEVAAVLVRNGEIGAHYRRLINPGRPIPQFITRFTGISEAMVARVPNAGKVLPKLRDFIGERPIVGHNVGFDLSFLNFEAGACGLAMPFPHEGIDTIAMARQFLTGMRRVRLDHVAVALHLPIHTRHRALPDAVLTAKVFALLLARAREEGCETLADLWQVVRGLPRSRSAPTGERITGKLYLNPAWRQQFPTRPGVYLMKDESGEVIYVGKAKCLRDRLASYYSQPLGYTRKMDGLLQSVKEIETRVLGSELEALLVESRLIKQLQPRYNVQLRNYELYPFIKLDILHAFPRFYATREVSPDGARYFGPFRSRRIVDTTLELLQRLLPLRTCTRSLPPAAAPSEPCLRYHLKRCPAPCRGALDEAAMAAYRTAVAEACAFLGGERDDLLDRLRRQMYEAAGRQDFERAARLRDALRDADQVLLGQRLITGAVEANNVLIVYPSSEDGHVEAFLVRHGRLVEQRRIVGDSESLAAAVHELLAVASRLGLPPARVGREEVDQINIIARWIHRHSEDDERAFFRLPADAADPVEAAAFVERVAAGIEQWGTLAGEPEDEQGVDADGGGGGAPNEVWAGDG